MGVIVDVDGHHFEPATPEKPKCMFGVFAVQDIRLKTGEPRIDGTTVLVYDRRMHQSWVETRCDQERTPNAYLREEDACTSPSKNAIESL